MHALLSHPVYGVIFIALIGACVGSFLNVVILRLPVMMQREWEAQFAEYAESSPTSTADTVDTARRENTAAESVFNLNKPRSRCPNCLSPLKSWHNIPVLSWLFLRGRCSSCQAAISWRYPFIELVTAVISAFLVIHLGFSWQLLGALVFSWSLIALTVIDIDHQLLPDSITLPLLWLGLLANLFGLFAPIESAVIGAIAGYGGFWLIYQIHHRLTGREGLGYGDFKLLAAIGAWSGWELLPVTILIASLSGTLIAMALLLLARLNLRAPMSFGPFLAIAGWISLVFGEQLTEHVLPLFQF